MYKVKKIQPQNTNDTKRYSMKSLPLHPISTLPSEASTSHSDIFLENTFTYYIYLNINESYYAHSFWPCLPAPHIILLCISTQIYHIPFNGYKSIWYQSFNNCSLEWNRISAYSSEQQRNGFCSHGTDSKQVIMNSKYMLSRQQEGKWQRIKR